MFFLTLSTVAILLGAFIALSVAVAGAAAAVVFRRHVGAVIRRSPIHVVINGEYSVAHGR
jgi:hypothetical protein